MHLKCTELAKFVVHYPGRFRYEVCGHHLIGLVKKAKAQGFNLIYEPNHSEYVPTCQAIDKTVSVHDMLKEKA